MKNYTPTKDEFFNQVKLYISNSDSLELIDKAYNFAKEKHKDQLRMSGEPYFNHLLCVGYEVSKLNAGPYTIAAALLHDCIEDCGVSKEEFIKEFNEEIYSLVEAVTKIGNLEFKDEKEYLAENHRKIFLAMAKDIRVIIIKLVDRLHNMRTLEYQPREKQLSISKETIEVYAPIAHRLGIAEIKNELEDLCFYYLDYEKYHEIASLVENKKAERDEYIDKMISDIKKTLDEHNIKYEIFGRSKHLYSIYNKMQRKNKRFEEILDLLAIRIITENESNCYETLGYIHATYHPIPGRLKDYIAMPKFNMYRSLHTTVIGIDGKIFEIQIRTKQMDQIAERGIAAHWAYKEGNYNKHEEQKEIINELKWLKSFEETETNNANDYMDTVGDLFNSNVYVMTPKGRVIDLPSGSTPIDFAYRIHTDIGHHTVGSIINGALVPLNTILKTGDVVELKINKNSSPSEDWIKICKTKNARNKINSFFQKKEIEEKSSTIKLGENLLKEEMIKNKINLDEYFKKEKFEKLFHIFKVHNINEFYYSLGCKSLSPTAVIQNLVKFSKKEIDENEINQILSKNKHSRKESNNTGIMVDGLNSMKVVLSPCCTPVYGDDIIGYVTKGKGIKAHRKECQNISSEDKRIIDLKWDSIRPINIKYEACIRIYCNDRSYLLTDLVACISQFKTTMVSVNISVNNDNLTATAIIVLKVDDKEQLENIMANLRKVESVISVERAFK